MEQFLRRLDNKNAYRDYANYPNGYPYPIPDGFELVEGQPEANSSLYDPAFDIKKTTLDLEKDFIEAIKIVSGMDPIPLSSMELQGMYSLKASVTEILKSAQAGLLPEFHLALAKQAIQDFQVPEVIQDLKDQLLSRFE